MVNSKKCKSAIRTLTLTLTLFFTPAIASYGWGSVDKPFSKSSRIDQKSQNTSFIMASTQSPYSQFSSAPNYIKITVRDSSTQKTINLVVTNPDFAMFLASESGLETDTYGRFKDTEALEVFLDKTYVPYMEKHGRSILDINLENFGIFFAKSYFLGSSKEPVEYLDRFIFNQPLTFQDLDVQDEDELIEKMFDFDKNTGGGRIKNKIFGNLEADPSFLALLIDLGYEVGHGDIVPFLWIHKQPVEN